MLEIIDQLPKSSRVNVVYAAIKALKHKLTLSDGASYLSTYWSLPDSFDNDGNPVRALLTEIESVEACSLSDLTTDKTNYYISLLADRLSLLNSHDYKSSVKDGKKLLNDLRNYHSMKDTKHLKRDPNIDDILVNSYKTQYMPLNDNMAELSSAIKHISDMVAGSALFESSNTILTNEFKDVVSSIDSKKYIYISGQAGIGKTTLLKHLSHIYLTKKYRLPFWINANDLIKTNDIESLIYNTIKELPSSINNTVLQKLISRCLLVLDDADYILNNANINISFAVEHFISKYPNSHVIMASRCLDSNSIPNKFHVHVLHGLNYDDMNRYIEVNNYKYTDLESAFDNIKFNESFKSMAGNPLFLSLASDVLAKTSKTSFDKTTLLRDYIELSLSTFKNVKISESDNAYRQLPISKKMSMLSKVAMLCMESNSASVCSGNVRRAIKSFIVNLVEFKNYDLDEVTNNILSSLTTENSLLTESNDNYVFRYASILEYLTAHEITRAHDIKYILQNHMLDSKWHEVIALASTMIDTFDVYLHYLIDQANILAKTELNPLFELGNSIIVSKSSSPIHSRILAILYLSANALANKQAVDDSFSPHLNDIGNDVLRDLQALQGVSHAGYNDPRRVIVGSICSKYVSKLENDKIILNNSTSEKYGKAIIISNSTFSALYKYCSISKLILTCINYGAFITVSSREMTQNNLFRP